MKTFAKLVKSGLVVFVVLSTAAGYWLSFRVEHTFDALHFLAVLFGTALISAGSFALNQAQESELDAAMPRTQSRPIPMGKMTAARAALIGVLLILSGSSILYLVKPLVAFLGLLTVVMYNGLYTLYWKPKWTFGAVPGALPGAMPVVLGYAANSSNLLAPDCIYAFFIMFLWQMPHFWALAIRFEKDYRLGGVPTLPVQEGADRTLYYIGVYLFAYLGLALCSPWLTAVKYAYLIFMLPFVVVVMWEFVRFFRAQGQKHWLPFFLWTNFSMLVFLTAPVVDRWATFWLNVR